MSVKTIVRESTSVLDLEKRLKAEGVVFKGLPFFKYRNMINYLNAQLGLLNIKDQTNSNETNSENQELLPYSEIKRDGVIYRIHGVFHGNGKFNLSDKVASLYAKKIQEFQNPPEEDYFLEEGFSELLKLDKSKEIPSQEAAADMAGIINEALFFS